MEAPILHQQRVISHLALRLDHLRIDVTGVQHHDIRQRRHPLGQRVLTGFDDLVDAAIPGQPSFGCIRAETPGRKVGRQAAERHHVPLLDLERVEKHVVVDPRPQQPSVDQHFVGVLPEDVVAVGMPGQRVTRLREVLEVDIDNAASRRFAVSTVSLETQRQSNVRRQVGGPGIADDDLVGDRLDALDTAPQVALLVLHQNRRRHLGQRRRSSHAGGGGGDLFLFARRQMPGSFAIAIAHQPPENAGLVPLESAGEAVFHHRFPRCRDGVPRVRVGPHVPPSSRLRAEARNAGSSTRRPTMSRKDRR